ncbi:imidazolonepropionase [Aliidiomarina quisquiliarum]|uniref:imidazolonepropionase n=1 Tax=Aliidiomarina quisquiliarum TaxID=2938947 RepID=UPI00208E4D6B|nr:imidazolonepropionase [Aliidiomarina quisquiliarum]MCO4322556.1 imidazolonepropionase [Aliidiomarina quisquiliarum]
MPTLFHNLTVATMNDSNLGLIEQGALVCEHQRIVWVGKEADLPAQWQPLKESPQTNVNGKGGLLTPALIDCHTHLVWGGSRANEFKQRLHGVSYEAIAAAGGGILSTVRATRAATEAELFASAKERAEALIAQGVSSIEIKSGYGLSLDDELKQLRVARKLGEELPVRVVTTLLAAHALPPEYKDRADDYITYICDTILPAAAAEGLADAVDVFCENIGFTRQQTERVFAAAQALGLPVKLHAEQLSDQDGASLVASYNGLSADHLEYLSNKGIAAMAAADTVAVLLPGAYYFLRETKLPPIEAMRTAGVKMAIATDANPGTSPIFNLPLMMHMACTLFRFTPEEAWLATTKHAAQALGLTDTGELKEGMRADLALWQISAPEELCYELGINRLVQRWFAGS